MTDVKSFFKSTKGKMVLTAVIAVIIGFVLGMEYKAYQVRSAIMDGFEDAFGDMGEAFETEYEYGVDSTVTTEEIEESDIEIVAMDMNEEVELDTFKITVNSIEETDNLIPTFGSPISAKKNSKFLLVDLDITNTTKSEFSLFPDEYFMIIDDQDRQFLTFDDSIGSVENYFNMRELSPSITENGFLVYELPADAEYYDLFTGDFTENILYRVVLKSEVLETKD